MTKNTIPLKPVTSSQIASIGHCPNTQTLAIQFKSGGHVYEYPGVTAEQHQELVNAKSIGKHFGANIKKLPFKKIEAA